MPDMNDPQDGVIAPVPRITIQAFCETPDVASAIESASTDWHMHKAHVKIQMGGAPAALEAYRSAPTPNVIMLESHNERGSLLQHLDGLSEFCDAGTKVVVIGHVNDVILYRELIRRGVSDYLIAPAEALDVVRTVSELFARPGAEPVGRVTAVVGAKGGTGASTVAHNLSWAVARGLSVQTVVVDLDIAFGTAGLNFNQDPPQGIADAIFAPERLDANLVDRLLSRCSDNLSLLSAPAMLDRTTDLNETAIDGVLDILRASVPCIILDVPHGWNAWTRRTLIASDEIVIVAAPELASLRNAKNMFEALGQARPNDRKPKIILNQVGVPKRPEIKPEDFAAALQLTPIATIPFDPLLFGTAANNGQMIAEASAKPVLSEVFTDVAQLVTGRKELKRKAKRGLDFGPLLQRLKGRQKARPPAKKTS